MVESIVFFLLALLCNGVQGFAPVDHWSSRLSRGRRQASPIRKMIPHSDIDLVTSAMPGFLLSKADSGDAGEYVKALIIALAFGGGLIPATIAGNKAMIETLTGQRRGGEGEELTDDFDPKDSLDPTIMESAYRKYVEDSGATGPTLANSGLLLAKEPIPLADVIAIVGRIRDKDSICDWRNLPSATREGTLNPERPPQWLPRGAFKVYIRKSKWLGWPVDPKTGEPVGGVELKAAEEPRIKKSNALIGDAALDAVWDSWAGGASITTPDKVDRQLASWHPSADLFDAGKFVGAAVSGRAQTGIAALTFIAIQVLAFGTLFIGPVLRTFFDIDIGFGEIGTCDPQSCVKLWNGI